MNPWTADISELESMLMRGGGATSDVKNMGCC